MVASSVRQLLPEAKFSFLIFGERIEWYFLDIRAGDIFIVQKIKQRPLLIIYKYNVLCL